MRFLGSCESFEPLCDFVEAFGACSLGEAWIHFGVLVGLAGDCGLKVRF